MALLHGAIYLRWEKIQVLMEFWTHLRRCLNISIPLLFKLTEALKLSSSDLENALENKAYEEKIKSDFTGGVRSGVNGTPTFFINGQRYNGSFDFEELISAMALCKKSDI
jgi:protein-disulfide isomerase